MKSDYIPQRKLLSMYVLDTVAMSIGYMLAYYGALWIAAWIAFMPLLAKILLGFGVVFGTFKMFLTLLPNVLHLFRTDESKLKLFFTIIITAVLQTVPVVVAGYYFWLL